jgi:hypothetical protein
MKIDLTRRQAEYVWNMLDSHLACGPDEPMAKLDRAINRKIEGVLGKPQRAPTQKDLADAKSNKRTKCNCPYNCRYCGRVRSKDSIGHYCKTENCQWSQGYSSCHNKVKCNVRIK